MTDRLLPFRRPLHLEETETAAAIGGLQKDLARAVDLASSLPDPSQFDRQVAHAIGAARENIQRIVAAWQRR